MRVFFLTAVLALTAAQAGAAPARDSNQDGKLTAAQFEAASTQRLMAADTNRDGKVSKAEFEAMAQARGGGMPVALIWPRLDADGDGFLSRTEVAKLSAQRFARLDANHDGVLSADERQAMRQARMSRGGAQ